MVSFGFQQLPFLVAYNGPKPLAVLLITHIMFVCDSHPRKSLRKSTIFRPRFCMLTDVSIFQEGAYTVAQMKLDRTWRT